MASDIAIVSLTATAAVGGFTLAALWAPPSVQASLPYMQAASVVFYASATNDFGAATVVGESPAAGLVQVGGLGNGVTRYVWARAKDPSGNLGDRYPAAGGVAVTTLNPAPGPNSIGTGQLQNGAVTNEKVTSISADKITAGVISALIEILGPTVTGGIIRTANSSVRVEMSGSTNSLTVMAGLVMGRISADASVTERAFFQGLTTQLGCLSVGGGTGNGHGLRGRGGPSGGMALVGVTPSGGGYGVYTESGGYGPFTGVHDALLPIADDVEIGEIVCSTGHLIAKSRVDDALLVVEASGAEAQRGAYGIVSRVLDFDPYSPIAALPPVHHDDPPTPIRLWIAANYRRLAVNGCGEGLVLVCGRGGDIAIGDYICTSSMRGKGQRQNDASGDADDLLRRHTVAQATQSVTFDDPDEVRLVACVYKCG